MDAFLRKAGNKPTTASTDPAPANVTMFDAAAAKPRYVPWIEKYRPTRIDDVSH